jgi:peptidyl-prolyl cis-trans isomerase B (cyclophilin B)
MSKKSPFQGALVLLAIAAALGAVVFFFVKPRREASEQKAEKSALLFGDLDRQKIVGFRLENGNGTVSLRQNAENNQEWLVSSAEHTYPADRTTVDGIVSTILASKQEATIANPDLAALGLQPPKYKLILDGAGKGAPARELWIGNDTPVDYLVYAKFADKPADKPTDKAVNNVVFTTSRSLRFGIDKRADEVRNKKILAIDLKTSNHFEFHTIPEAHKKPELIAFDKNEAGVWKASKPFAVAIVADELTRFVDGLNKVAVTEFASENPADRPALGFKAPVTEFRFGDAAKPDAMENWLVAEKTEKKPTAPKGEAPIKKVYLSRATSDSTYGVGETFLDNFRTNLFRFRAKTITELKTDDVDGFTLQNDKITLNFRKEGKGWKLKWKKNGQDVEADARPEPVHAALDALAQLKALEYFDTRTPSQLGLQRPSRVVELRYKSSGEAKTKTLFFGNKLPEGRIVVRTEGLDAAAATALDAEATLPLKAEYYLPVAAPSDAKAGAGAPGGTKKVKLEATVPSPKEIRKLPGPIVKPGHKYTAEITMANGKKIVITFDAAKAPYTVSNFLHLARNGFYDGVVFHRVIADFVAQGGDPTGSGAGGPGYKFDNEDNDLKHLKGSISMAHAGRNTNGSQFFLVLKPQPHLDGLHTVFGQITEGLDVMDAIKKGDVMKKVEVFEESL